MVGTTAIEHGSSRSGRWLRQRRVRIVLWIAAIEGLLYLFGVLHWWAAVGLAAIALAFWWFVGRSSRSDSVRHVAWIFAASQVLVICVPIASHSKSLSAIGVIALLAVGALIFLFSERP